MERSGDERFAGGWLSQRDIRAGANTRLFCLPHAGSGAATFYRWKRDLTEIDVCPVLLPGREMRLAERSMEDASVLVDALIEAIAPHLDVTFAIFGHSMGALLAYELAKRLEQRGSGEPVCLFVSGREAAHLPFGHRELHLLEDDAFASALAERYGGAPQELLADAELRSIFLPILRADLRLVENYRHDADEMLRCDVIAFAGSEDWSVSEAGLRGWGELTQGEFAARRFAGDHFFHSGEGQAQLLNAISERLSTVDPPGGTYTLKSSKQWR